MIAALVDRRARIVWSCFPRFDGDPVFSALLDARRAGRRGAARRLRDRPDRHADLRAGLPRQHRRPRLDHDRRLGNVLEITDFAPRFTHFDRTFRPPQLIRRVRPLKGRPRIRVRLRPHFEWGERQPDTRAAATICASSGRPVAAAHHRRADLLRGRGAPLRGRPAALVLLRRPTSPCARRPTRPPANSSTRRSTTGATGFARSRSPSTGRRR